MEDFWVAECPDLRKGRGMGWAIPLASTRVRKDRAPWMSGCAMARNQFPQNWARPLLQVLQVLFRVGLEAGQGPFLAEINGSILVLQ
jgi:hypothetical protein